jgi:virginiamycin B lyase
MRIRNVALCLAACLSLLLVQVVSRSARGQSVSPLALTGLVSSQEEGPMEGVLVSAKAANSTISITVVSDEHGRYSFPRAKLDPGPYTLRIRAVGYDLDDPGTLEITAEKAATADLKLHMTKNLSSQLTSAEWIQSFPGTTEQRGFLLGCVTCHTQERVAKSLHDADEWMQVYQRMSGYAPESQPSRPQLRRDRRDDGGMEGVSINQARQRKQAEWMATINLSAVEKWAYPLQTLPRPKGRGTHVIITEYMLPRPNTMPHDAVVDSKGMVWYTDFGWQFLGKLDPKTGKTEEYPVPELKANFPLGMLDLEADKNGDFWIAQMLQGGFAKFDTKTLKFTNWSIPKEFNTDATQINMVMPSHAYVDGKVWTQDTGSLTLHRLDIETGKIETFDPYAELPNGRRGHGIYDVATDAQNNAFFTDIGGGNIGRADAKTGKITLTPTPSRAAGKPSGPRRAQMDSLDRLWYGDFRGNRVGMYDTRAGKFQEWDAPEPWIAPYDAELDKNGELWAGGITSDRVLRLNTKTGQFTEYLLPRYTSIRRVFVDNSTNPVTFWVPSNHGNSIVKLEPLD